MQFKNNIIQIICYFMLGIFLQIVFPTIGKIKPDFLLIAMLLSILSTKNILTVWIICLMTAALSMTLTIFPGGQIASWFDKIVAGFFVFMLYQKISVKKKTPFKAAFLCFTATLLSGMIFFTVSTIVEKESFMIWKNLILSFFPTVIFPMSLISALTVLLFQNTIIPKKIRK